MRVRWYTLAAVLLVVTPAWAQGERPARAPVPPGVPTTAENVHLPTEGEVRLGREGAQEVERIFKVIPAGPYHERLQRISSVVVANIQRQDIIEEYKRKYNLPKDNDKSRRVPFEYSFKVIDVPREVNAFSLAGGPIYVTTALMDMASDHELAAVLGHECAHVAFHHIEQLIRKQRRVNSTQLLGLLAAVLAGAAGGGQAGAAAANVALGAQLVGIARVTAYSQDLEHEADRIGSRTLVGTPYSPVGMLTFMRKLAVEERRRDGFDPGIFRTHPYSNQRVEAIKKELVALGFRVDEGSLREVSGRFRLAAVPITVDGRPACEIRLNNNLVFTCVAYDGDLNPVARAEHIIRGLDGLFKENVSSSDVKLAPDRGSVTIRGITFFRPFSEDAAFAGGVEAAAEKAYREIVRALLQEQIDKPF